ncbi:flagellar biosynthetic protein FliR [Ruficoccus amylovorans]|uniref:Flagellar biosynthetic protein FliR n=1 Tax=Ruficoccus amylovorans TaxID=1804625 RepID=A0A842HII3_9BACT|nr:flagellar biosynthetic protein FliR [Ruficoccus amylovorans]MBC2595021.1 flagellar biosynthetic protein FliR [Ruficoccus amylovorans]
MGDVNGMILVGGAVFLRAGAFFAFVPFTGRPVPVFVRVALALFMAIVALTTLPRMSVPEGPLLSLLPLVLVEALIGLAMAFAVQKIFIICQIAGIMIAQEIGLMQGGVFNPLLGQQESLVGSGMNLLAIVLLFSLGLHREVISAFLESLRLLPPMNILGSGAAEEVLKTLSRLFLSAVQMAAPFIAMNFIVVLAFGVLGRAAPAINVLFVSFPVRLLVGLLLLAALTPFLGRQILMHLQNVPGDMIRLINVEHNGRAE